MDKRVCLKWLKRLLLVLVLPVFLIVFLWLCLNVISYVDEYCYKHKYDNSRRLSRVTGVRIPKFEVVAFEEGRYLSHQKMEDCLHAEFEALPTEEFYEVLDSLVAIEESNWDISDGNLFYYIDAQRKFRVHILRGSKQFYVYYGGDDIFWKTKE